MMAKLLDGNLVSNKIKQEIAKEVEKLNQKYGTSPHLATVLVGENKASKIYINNKILDCKEVGFRSSVVKLSENISQIELLEIIHKLNFQEDLDGYIVQLPLPQQIDQEKIIMEINPDKDVDGFHPQNFGKMALEIDTLLPATPYGILYLLSHYQIPTQGKHCVIIGRSRIVGKPMSILMGGRKKNYGNSTVTLIHSNTLNIAHYTKQADIVIIAVGIPNFLTVKMIKKGAVIIDVGINRREDKKHEKGYYLEGDVDFEEVKKKASWITTVPGGVGPMTRAMLLKNTLLAFKNNYLK